MPNTIPKLPLLQYALELFPNVNLNKTLIIGVQHILPTTLSFFRSLFSMGLQPGNLKILGKCYSTNPHVLVQMESDGVCVSKWSTFFNSHVHYDSQFDESIKQFVHESLSELDFREYEKVVFLDDGGHLLAEIHRLDIRATSVCGIEQTSSGYNRTKHLPFNFPIVNLARSAIKLQLETPFIIRDALNCLNRVLTELEISDCSILLLGHGVLGNAVRNSLETKFKVHVYDIDPKRSSIASENLERVVENSTLIIGCTGAISLPQKMHKSIAPSTILASMSSSDREFDALYLRKRVPKETDCHCHMDINGIQLLNCGFPINFSDDYATVDSTDFEITRALLLTSVAQIHLDRDLASGFHDLDGALQRQLMQKFLDSRKQQAAVYCLE